MVSRLPRRDAGVTLPELLTVVAIIGVLASIAAPSLSEMIESQRARSATGDLYAAIARTRSEAVKRNMDVTLTATTSGHWEGGWTIANPSSAGFLEQHGAVLKTTITGPNTLVFQNNGRLRGATQPKFNIATNSGHFKRCIEVDLGGRPLQKPNAC